LDEARRDLGPALVEVAVAAGAKADLFELEQVESRPIRQLPRAIADALETAQASVLMVGFNDSEAPMRLQLLEEVRRLNLRHAHMVGITRKSLLAGFTVDPSRILDTTRAVRTRVRPDSKLKLRTPAGSDLDVKLDPAFRWAEHVGVIRPGRWENLPSGELMTAPSEVHGVFVADASIGGRFGQTAGLLARNPIRFEIEHNEVKRVTCTDRQLQRDVEQFIHQDPYAHFVGTIIIGTNIGITEPIGELVCDQNTPGLHMSLGSTFPEKTGAPTRTRIQITMTSMHGDVDLDGTPLIRNGRYMIV
jgi:leucyl aminopeptidase (aminopeptidase T)